MEMKAAYSGFPEALPPTHWLAPVLLSFSVVAALGAQGYRDVGVGGSWYKVPSPIGWRGPQERAGWKGCVGMLTRPLPGDGMAAPCSPVTRASSTPAKQPGRVEQSRLLAYSLVHLVLPHPLRARRGRGEAASWHATGPRMQGRGTAFALHMWHLLSLYTPWVKGVIVEGGAGKKSPGPTLELRSGITEKLAGFYSFYFFILIHFIYRM